MDEIDELLKYVTDLVDNADSVPDFLTFKPRERFAPKRLLERDQSCRDEGNVSSGKNSDSAGPNSATDATSVDHVEEEEKKDDEAVDSA